MNVVNERVAVGKRPRNRLFNRADHGRWTEGTVVTQHGIVEVYAQGGDKYCHFSSVSIIKDGALFTRKIIGKRYTQRGLVTLANRFAGEVFGMQKSATGSRAVSKDATDDLQVSIGYDSQSVQRCRVKSDVRYGAVHRLAGNKTDCGLEITCGDWWVLGSESDNAVTCKACLSKESGRQ